MHRHDELDYQLHGNPSLTSMAATQPPDLARHSRDVSTGIFVGAWPLLPRKLGGSRPVLEKAPHSGRGVLGREDPNELALLH